MIELNQRVKIIKSDCPCKIPDFETGKTGIVAEIINPEYSIRVKMDSDSEDMPGWLGCCSCIHPYEGNQNDN